MRWIRKTDQQKGLNKTISTESLNKLDYKYGDQSNPIANLIQFSEPAPNKDYADDIGANPYAKMLKMKEMVKEVFTPPAKHSKTSTRGHMGREAKIEQRKKDLTRHVFQKLMRSIGQKMRKQSRHSQTDPRVVDVFEASLVEALEVSKMMRPLLGEEWFDVANYINEHEIYNKDKDFTQIVDDYNTSLKLESFSEESNDKMVEMAVSYGKSVVSDDDLLSVLKQCCARSLVMGDDIALCRDLRNKIATILFLRAQLSEDSDLDFKVQCQLGLDLDYAMDPNASIVMLQEQLVKITDDQFAEQDERIYPQEFVDAAKQVRLYNNRGFDQFGCDRRGYDEYGFNSEGYNREGFDFNGFNKLGYDAEGYDQEGIDPLGLNNCGEICADIDKDFFLNRSPKDAISCIKEYQVKVDTILQSEGDNSEAGQKLLDDWNSFLKDVSKIIQSNKYDNETGHELRDDWNSFLVQSGATMRPRSNDLSGPRSSSSC